MNKVFATVDEAVADIPTAATVLIGGFAGSGVPSNLVQALAARGVSDLTVVCNDAMEFYPLVQRGHVRKLIAGFTSHPMRPEISRVVDAQVREGKLEVETVPHGVLEERLRAGAGGIAGFYSPVGIGTVVEEGKEKREFQGREYLLERGLRADYALVKGWKADRWGNVITRLAAGNRNIGMAMAAETTIIEVEELVALGDLDPNRIDIPGIFVKRIVCAPKIALWFVKGETPGIPTTSTSK